MKSGRTRRRVLMLAAVAGMSLGLAADEMAVVKQKELDVRVDKRLSSGVAFTAVKGETLRVTDKGADGWWGVSQAGEGGKAGFVRGLQLTEAKLRLAGAGSAAPLTGSRDAEASAATKGIDPDALKYGSTKGYDATALMLMIDTRDAVTPADVEQFRRDGGLR